MKDVCYPRFSKRLIKVLGHYSTNKNILEICEGDFLKHDRIFDEAWVVGGCTLDAKTQKAVLKFTIGVSDGAAAGLAIVNILHKHYNINIQQLAVEEKGIPEFVFFYPRTRSKKARYEGRVLSLFN